ncbi:MAG: 16S rRNA (guanine(966)-N(2))-methyltransferase RsmD [Kiritimatiellia bacterium]
MRITGGGLSGLTIKVPRGIRPTQDRVREALFSILADRVRGAAFADLFAGSGAVGIDAVSRGAAKVCWVERGRGAGRLLKENVNRLCRDTSTSLRIAAGDVFRFLQRENDLGPYDIIFADPPYALGKSGEKEKDAAALLKAVSASRVLSENGLFIIEQAAGRSCGRAAGWESIDKRTYGGTSLEFMRPENS